MAIKIQVSKRIKFNVAGSLTNEAGIAEPFGFKLVADRLDSDQVQELVKGDSSTSIADFFVTVVHDWEGVKDVEGAFLPYNETNLRALFKIAGLAGLAFTTYLREIGAKEKN